MKARRRSQAARRELIEETGYRARKWEKLSTFFPSPGFVAERMTIYLATELTAGTATPMDDERIEARWYTRKELAEMIRSRENRRRQDDYRFPYVEQPVAPDGLKPACRRRDYRATPDNQT